MIDARYLVVVLASVVLVSGTGVAGVDATSSERSEAMRDSVVHVATSAYGYDLREPWKNEGLSDKWSCGAAVGPYQVITTANSVANHADIKVLRYGQNEFVPATPKVIDYESDLCLLELDREKLREPLKPLVFVDDRPEARDVSFHWLSPDSRLYDGRGDFDRVYVEQVRTSFGRRLRYAVANTSQSMGRGEVYCIAASPIGIGCWAGSKKEADLIPGRTINRFLDALAAGQAYAGFGELGFATSELRDPAVRSFLKMPPSLRNGVYVSDVYTLGTGSDSLRKEDVVLSVDGHAVDAQGRYSDPVYGDLSFHHLITGKLAGSPVPMLLWRQGGRVEVSVEVRSFKSDQMLVPFQEFDRQPEYVVVGGFLFQKLTREYLLEFGDNLAGQAPSHLYHYYRGMGFKPTDQRRDIVMLSYVLPTQTNLGYTSLGRLVVRTFNGMPVGSIGDIVRAQELNPGSDHHVVEFELSDPTVVIPRRSLSAVDAYVSNNYGVAQLSNINR